MFVKLITLSRTTWCRSRNAPGASLYNDAPGERLELNHCVLDNMITLTLTITTSTTTTTNTNIPTTTIY